MPVFTTIVPREVRDPGGTSREFRNQWHNPKEVTAVLLIIGGEIVQKALAQLSGPKFVPVAFSFGWVAYAFSSIVSLVGDCRLLPEPDYRCKVINVENGFGRESRSWIIGRLLRDSEPVLDKESLCVEVFVAQREQQTRPRHRPGEPETRVLLVFGIGVIIIQLVVAAIPCILYDDWGVLLITGAGTLFALFTGLLPQWRAEKYACREKTRKTLIVSAGNGSRYAMVILGKGRGLDLEDLAGGEGPRSQRLWEKHGLFTKFKTQTPPGKLSAQSAQPAHPQHSSAGQVIGNGVPDHGDNNSEYSEAEMSKAERKAQPTITYTVPIFNSLPLDLWFTRVVCLILTIAWIALLVFVAALEENAWFLLVVGGIGMAQNAVVAGMRLKPSQRGIHLRKISTEKTGKVMDVIMDVDSAFQGKNIGKALLDEFFPADLTREDEIKWWDGSDKDLYDAKRVDECATRGLPYLQRQKS